MIIGLSGKARSGKNTVASLLQTYTEDNYGEISFAGGLREVTEILLGRQVARADGLEKETMRVPLGNRGTSTPRKLLQKIGVLMRDNLYSDIWVDVLYRSWIVGEKNPNYLITDVRFPNEAKAVRSWGGKLVRIEREARRKVNQHESETALDDWHTWDCVIDNNGTLESLEDKVSLLAREWRL